MIEVGVKRLQILDKKKEKNVSVVKKKKKIAIHR